MKVFSFIIFLSFLTFIQLSAQVVDFRTIVSHSDSVWAVSIHELESGEYVLHGYYHTSKIRFLQYFDTTGNYLRTDTILGWNVDSTSIVALRQITPSNKLLMLHYDSSSIYLSKTDSLGQISWTTSLVDSVWDDGDWTVGNSIVKELEDESILFIHTLRSQSSVNYMFYIIRLDSIGTIIDQFNQYDSPNNLCFNDGALCHARQSLMDSLIYRVGRNGQSYVIYIYDLQANLIKEIIAPSSVTCTWDNYIQAMAPGKFLFSYSEICCPTCPYFLKFQMLDTTGNTYFILNPSSPSYLLNTRRNNYEGSVIEYVPINDGFVYNGMTSFHNGDYFIGSVEANGSINWTFTDSTIRMALGVDMIRTSDNGVLVLATNKDWMGFTIMKIDSVNIISELNEFENEDSCLKFHPNPVDQKLIISNSQKVIHYSIQNTMGYPIVERNVNSEEVLIDVSSVNDGIYLISIITEDGIRQTQKVIIQH